MFFPRLSLKKQNTAMFKLFFFSWNHGLFQHTHVNKQSQLRGSGYLVTGYMCRFITLGFGDIFPPLIGIFLPWWSYPRFLPYPEALRRKVGVGVSTWRNLATGNDSMICRGPCFTRGLKFETFLGWQHREGLTTQMCMTCFCLTATQEIRPEKNATLMCKW